MKQDKNLSIEPQQNAIRVILASTSPYRKAQLESLRIAFEALDPGVDEADLKRTVSHPRELAIGLAVAKAEAIARQDAEAVVIGGDQLVSFEGEILGKPGAPENAVEQLLRLAGHCHELVTAVAISHQGKTRTHLDQTRLWMRDLDRAAAERYVAADRPLDCAGAYKIESLGIALFERIESSDHTAITGLPLMAVSKLLNDLGIPIP